MDRETKKAYEIVQKKIVSNIDRLTKLQKEGVKLSNTNIDSLKKWRRFGAAFAWDPSVFQDVLENPTMSDVDLISRLRKTEEGLMRQFQYIKGIPLHHIIADRTGGDLGIRTPIDIWEDTKKRIFDLTGATPGNNQANLNALGAFDELWHQGRTGAKGSVFAATGIIRPEDFPFLHRSGQYLAERLGLDPQLVQASAAEQAAALGPAVVGQQNRFIETTATDQVQRQRNVLTQIGFSEITDPNAPPGVIQNVRKAIEKTPIPRFFAGAADLKFDPLASMKEFAKTPEFKFLQDSVNEGRIKDGLPEISGDNLYSTLIPFAKPDNFLKGLKSLIKENVGGETMGSLYSLLLDPEMRQAVEENDGNKVAGIITRDVGTGLAGSAVTKALLPMLPSAVTNVVAPIVAPVASAAATALPVAAVSQIGGSTDPFVTQQQNIRALEEGSDAAVKRKSDYPSQFGAMGPDVTQAPEPLIKIEDPINELKYVGKQVLNFFKGGVKLEEEKEELPMSTL
jgi:hypothetical protein